MMLRRGLLKVGTALEENSRDGAWSGSYAELGVLTGLAVPTVQSALGDLVGCGALRCRARPLKAKRRYELDWGHWFWAALEGLT